MRPAGGGHSVALVMSLRAPIVAAAAGLALASCGGSSKPGYCSDRSDLQQSVKDLGNDVTSGNLGAVQSQLNTVKSKASTLVSSAKSDFPNETSAIRTSLSTLETSVKGLSKSPTTTQVAATGLAVKSVVSAVTGFADATKSKCS